MRAFVPGSVTLSGDMGWGGGHACPIPYQIKHILGISALEADAGVF